MDDKALEGAARMLIASVRIARALMAVAECEPGMHDGAYWCWCRERRRKLISSGEIGHAPYCIEARDALRHAGLLK